MLIERDKALRSYNSFGVAARAAHFAAVDGEGQLARAFEFADRRGLPVQVLGGGTNVLFTRDWPGLVVHLAGRGVRWLDGDRRVRAAAGESWHRLVAGSVEKGACGLENLALIPGSAGAAPIQNIGAYGVELADAFESARVYDRRRGAFRRMSAADCRFAYRDSVFRRPEGEGLVVWDITLRLGRRFRPRLEHPALRDALAGGEPTPRRVFDAVCAVRSRRLPDPAALGNAGSFFKNPVLSRGRFEELRERHPALPGRAAAEPDRVRVPAGWLLDSLGWKGRSRGGASVDRRHALVIVNAGGASGPEIRDLARAMRDSVRERFGIALEPEVNIL